MPVLLWLTRLVGSTVAWLVNVVVALGLFLLSAHLFALADSDAEPPAYILRGIAAIWLCAATWHYGKHGVLQRPKPMPSERQTVKIGTREGVASTAGCLATIAAIIVVAIVVGQWADWVYAGLWSDDAAHPVKQALQEAEAFGDQVAAQPEDYLPSIVGVIVVLALLRAMHRLAQRHERQRTREDTGVRRPTRRERHRQREREKARAKGSSPMPIGASSETARATASAPTVARETPGSGRRMSNSGRTLTEPMLGTLRRDDAAGGWRLQNPRNGVGDLLIKAEGEPSEAQLKAAYAIVQRSFEVLLRASEGAAPAAQANGVGLPRFTIADSVIGEGGGANPPVTVHLRCDADPGRVYKVMSTDGMHTFGA